MAIRKINKKMNKKKIALIITAGFFVLVIGVIVFRPKSANSNQQNNDTAVSNAYDIAKSYRFNARDAAGNILEDTLILEFYSVEKKNEVFIQGQKAEARNDKIFLVFDIGVKNESDKILYLNVIDLVRLMESDDTLIAPQITQGNLEVRPISTKKTNFGFVVPTNESTFKLQVGELNGPKQVLEIEGVK